MALSWLGSSAAPGGRMPSSRPGALTRLGTLGLTNESQAPDQSQAWGVGCYNDVTWASSHRRVSLENSGGSSPRKEGICEPSELIWP